MRSSEERTGKQTEPTKKTEGKVIQRLSWRIRFGLGETSIGGKGQGEGREGQMDMEEAGSGRVV